MLQVRSVPIRKDDEVQVVRGTFKVGCNLVCVGALDGLCSGWWLQW